MRFPFVDQRPRVRHLLAGVAAVAIMSTQSVTAASVAVLHHPTHNLAAPALLQSTGSCTKHPGGPWTCQSPCAPHLHLGYNDSPGCLALALGAIQHGRAREQVPPLVLPLGFARLSVPEQLFVLVNLARIARSVPPLVGLTAPLDRAAASAAARDADATARASYGPIQARAMGATWAGGQPNAAAALFGWVYDDGWGGPRNTPNSDCTGPSAPACWGHRRVLLGEDTGTLCTICVAGAAFFNDVRGGNGTSYGFIIVRPSRTVTSLAYSWNRDVLSHLPPRERVPAR
ncbi:MAG: hypothetical protein M0004_12070 [Actinomycetota bacterium]|nr:hypothetical protein [Actinomycetota bacterium]